MKLPNILPAPKTPERLNENAQWLAGEGAGSWFVISNTDAKMSYCIERFAPNGDLECSGIFKTEQEFLITTPFVIDYPSHCAVVTFIQAGKKITLSRF